MGKNKSYNRLKRGELEVFTIEFTKEELNAAPAAHRSLYLCLGQTVNELVMLQSLLVRSLQGMKGSRPAKETALGISLLLARLTCARLVEASNLINAKQNSKLLDEVWSALLQDPNGPDIRSRADEARKRLNKALGPSSSIIRLVRNKLSAHLDQEILDEAFDRMSPDINLADFHTRDRGTTFFGAADTVAALAVGCLQDNENMVDGIAAMADATIRAVSDVQDFAEGFLVGFYLLHFGSERLRAAQRTLLTNLPEVGRAGIGFYLAGNKVRRQTGRD